VDIENERLLEPRDEEVSTFANGLVVENSTDTVEDDGALATVNGVER